MIQETSCQYNAIQFSPVCSGIHTFGDNDLTSYDVFWFITMRSEIQSHSAQEFTDLHINLFSLFVEEVSVYIKLN